MLDDRGELQFLAAPVRSEVELRAFRGSLSAVQEAGRYDDWYHPIIYENPLIDWLASVRLASWVSVDLYRWLFDPDGQTLNGRFEPTSRRFRLQVKLLRDFADSVSARGAEPYFVILTDQESIRRRRQGEETLYRAITDSLAAGDVPVIDLADALARDAALLEDLFMPRRHYSPTANAVVAREIASRLGLRPR